MGVVYTPALRSFPGRAVLCGISRRSARFQNIRLPGLRIVWIPAGSLLPGKPLARGTAALESVEQSWPAISSAMEHDGSVSAVAFLRVVPALVVVAGFLPGAFVAGRPRHVFPGIPLDGESPGRRGRRRGFCDQRADPQLADLAQ